MKMDKTEEVIRLWIDTLPYIMMLTLGFVFWFLNKKD